MTTVTDSVNKKEFLRITSTKWAHQNMLNRYAKILALRERNLSWKEIAVEIDRHWTTAARLYRAAVRYQEKMEAALGVAPNPTASKTGMLLLHQAAI